MNTKQKALEILLENAEEPEAIKDGTGTFTTFRTEYLINDISALCAQAQKDTAKEILGMLGGDENGYLDHGGEYRTIADETMQIKNELRQQFRKQITDTYLKEKV